MWVYYSWQFFLKFNIAFKVDYSEFGELESSLDRNGNLPNGIRVTGESKQLKDEVLHQVIKEAESSQQLNNIGESDSAASGGGINRARCKLFL